MNGKIHVDYTSRTEPSPRIEINLCAVYSENLIQNLINFWVRLLDLFNYLRKHGSKYHFNEISVKAFT